MIAILTGKVLQNGMAYSKSLYIYQTVVKYNINQIDKYEIYKTYLNFDEDYLGTNFNDESTYCNQICTQFRFLKKS